MTNRYEFLLANRGVHSLTALPVGPLPSYVAVDRDGQLVLAVPARAGSGAPHNLETQYLRLQLHVDVTVTQVGQEPTVGAFHLLTCTRRDPGAVFPFEALVTGLAQSLYRLDDTDQSLLEAFQTLCDLFRTPAVADIQRGRIGLWGELFVMRETTGYSTLVPFWHTEPSRKFDFSSGNRRLEIKATTGKDRVHRFSHGQLYTAGETEILVGSLLLRYDDAGLSLAVLR